MSHYDIPKPAGGQDVFHAGPCQSGWPGKKVTLAKKGQVTLQTKFKFAIVHVANKNKSCEENWRGPVPNKSLSGVSIHS